MGARLPRARRPRALADAAAPQVRAVQDVRAEEVRQEEVVPESEPGRLRDRAPQVGGLHHEVGAYGSPLQKPRRPPMDERAQGRHVGHRELGRQPRRGLQLLGELRDPARVAVPRPQLPARCDAWACATRAYAPAGRTPPAHRTRSPPGAPAASQFKGTEKFNADLSKWDVAKGTDFNDMVRAARTRGGVAPGAVSLAHRRPPARRLAVRQRELVQRRPLQVGRGQGNGVLLHGARRPAPRRRHLKAARPRGHRRRVARSSPRANPPLAVLRRDLVQRRPLQLEGGQGIERRLHGARCPAPRLHRFPCCHRTHRLPVPSAYL